MTNTQKPLTVWLVGSTQHIIDATKQVLLDASFKIQAVITPAPQPIGRQQVITPTPLHQLALTQNWPIILIDQKIDQISQNQVEKLLSQVSRPDFLLVVDFGYLIPEWLRKLPRIATVNLHPSALPSWRGASPGQFVILSGSERSAVSVMELSSGIDQGPIFTQIGFDVDPSWSSWQYYDYSFNLAGEFLASILTKISHGLKPQPQPPNSPTCLARKLVKSDGFISWEVLRQIMAEQKPELKLIPQLWREVWTDQALKLANWTQILRRFTLALTPWPGVWTKLPTQNGERIIKVLEFKGSDQKLELYRVQLDGQKEALWNQVKNVWVES